MGLNKELEEELRALSLARCGGMCWVFAPEHQEDVELTGDTLPPQLLLPSSLSKTKLLGCAGTLTASSLSESSNWSFLFIVDWTMIEDMSEPFELKSKSLRAWAEFVMSARMKAELDWLLLLLLLLWHVSMLDVKSRGERFGLFATGAFSRLVPGVWPARRTDFGVWWTASWIWV